MSKVKGKDMGKKLSTGTDATGADVEKETLYRCPHCKYEHSFKPFITFSDPGCPHCSVGGIDILMKSVERVN